VTLRQSFARNLLAIFLITTAIPTASAADAPGLVGTWSGTLHAGSATLRLVLHVTSDPAGKLQVALDSIDQHVMGLAGSNAIVQGNSFKFEVTSVHGSYAGTLSADGNKLSGTWTQNGSLPLDFERTKAEAAPTPEATPTPMPARSPVALRDLKPILDLELAPALTDGLLSKRSGGGLVIGVLSHGERRIFSYGTAHPDSVFEIGSISKTFTGLILAQMTVQKKVTLDEPILALLPPGFVGKQGGPVITLLDIATQHSGLPRMPDNFSPENQKNPYADYDPKQLSEFMTKQGLVKPAAPKFLYSNLGFGLLGYALSQRAGVSYPGLLRDQITGPLHLQDTVINLSPAQRKRLIQGYNAEFDPAEPWDFDAIAGAGAIRSTAADMLTYLDANLHPDKYAAGAAPRSPAATLPAAIAIDHEPRAEVDSAAQATRIALAWFIVAKTGSYTHSGGTGGYGTYAVFNPGHDYAVIALYNRDNNFPRFVDRVGENISELLLGEPATPPPFTSDADRRALAHPVFDDSSIDGSYRCVVSALSLPGKLDGKFNAVSSGDIHAVADGKGKLTQGTWEYKIVAPNLDITCKMKLVSGSYSVKPDGTGTQEVQWVLTKPDSPRVCLSYFSASAMKVHTQTQMITMDKAGRMFYTTTLSPAAALNGACERETAK